MYEVWLDWLNTLKPGDKVVVSGGRGGERNSMYIGTIDTIEEYTREIRIGYKIFVGGLYSEGKLGAVYGINPVCPETIQIIERHDLVSTFFNVKWESYSNELLKEILDKLKVGH